MLRALLCLNRWSCIPGLRRALFLLVQVVIDITGDTKSSSTMRLFPTRKRQQPETNRQKKQIDPLRPAPRTPSSRRRRSQPPFCAPRTASDTEPCKVEYLAKDLPAQREVTTEERGESVLCVRRPSFRDDTVTVCGVNGIIEATTKLFRFHMNEHATLYLPSTEYMKHRGLPQRKVGSAFGTSYHDIDAK